MDTKMWKDVRIIPASGESGWHGGAYTLAFVYSNKGNFLMKGYLKEIQAELDKLKTKGYKYIVNLSLRHTGLIWDSGSFKNVKSHRDIWDTSNKRVYISNPDSDTNNKWEIRKYGDKDNVETLLFRRLPNKWISDFDKIIT